MSTSHLRPSRDQVTGRSQPGEDSLSPHDRRER
jgi:hypothetical protein